MCFSSFSTRVLRGFRGLRASGVLLVGTLSLCLATQVTPADAATLRGTIYDAAGVYDLKVGGLSYDLTFHDARSGSWFDRFMTTGVPTTLSVVDNAALARAVLSALQDFIQPMGPIQVNNGQDLLVMPFASDGTDIQYLTTLTGPYNWGGVYGTFEANAMTGAFHQSVSFVTAQRSGAGLSAALTPVPGPGAGIALLGALGLGGVVLRRKRAARA